MSESTAIAFPDQRESLPLRIIYCSQCMRSVTLIARADMPHLTERQRQCLEGFIARKTAKHIGRDLGITHYAVEQHLKAARKKLGAANTLEAARRYAGSAYATVEPYYAAAEVPHRAEDEPCQPQPRHSGLWLRDVATDGPAFLQSLSPMQTLAAIGICGIGMITILSLIVAVADGVAQLAH
jgi:DNA-binding CsgD family transcriptional regulator